MAVAYETSLTPANVTFAEAGEAETVNFNAGTGSDRILLVFVLWRDRGNTITSVTYAGDGMTPAGAQLTSDIISGRLYYLLNPDPNANDIVVTISAGGGGDSLGQISAWVGNGAGGISGYQSGSGSGSSANIVTSLSSPVTSASGDRVVAFHITQNDTNNITATPTNYTERQDGNNGAGYSSEFGDADGAATVDPQATWSNGAFLVRWVAAGINITAAGGGGGGGTMGFITNNLRPNAFAPGLAR